MAAGLDGCGAIVTGGGRGIGRTIAAALVAAGARVVIADNGTSLDGQGADPTIATDAATALGDRAIAFADSIASPGAASAAVDLAVRRFGGLDIVVNCAAIRRPAPVAAIEAQDWEAVLRTNLSAPFYLTSAAGRRMRAQRQAGRAGGGRIVNMLSIEGLHSRAGDAAGASAKAGLIGLTRATAQDLADIGVTANAVLPLSPMRSTGGTPPTTEARYVADVVVALCHPAAGATTGQLWGVRGDEVLLFGQSRAVARLAGGAARGTPEAVIDALLKVAAGKMTPLDGAPEAFDSQPRR